MKNIPCAKLILASVLLSASAAQAQTTPATDYSLLPGTTRGYVGLNLGQAEFDTNCRAGFACETDDFGYKIYAGGRVNQIFGVELGLIDFGKVARLGGDTKAYGLNLSLVGTIPLGEMATIFGKVGTTLARTNVSSSIPGYAQGREDDFGLSYGLGVGFNVTPRVQVVGEWERHRLDFKDGAESVSLYTVGLRYRF